MTPQSQLNQISKHYENIDRVKDVEISYSKCCCRRECVRWLDRLACVHTKQIRTAVGVEI